MEFILGLQAWFSIQKSIKVIQYIKRLKKNHMIILNDAEKLLTKIQHHSCLIFFPEKIGMEWNLFNMMKTIYKKLNVILNRDAFPLIWGNKTRKSVLTTLI